MKTLTIIDTFGFLFRSYYALPPLRSRSGFPTGMLTGFMNFISNIGKDFQTDYIVFALDSKGPTFRKDIYEQYKAHRPDVPEDLLRQLPIAVEFIEKMGFKTAARVGFEADDMIASIAVDAKAMGLKVRIVSHDKDLYQLIDEDDIFMFDPMKKVVVSKQMCFDKYGVYPEQFIDYQSLLGDSADNVPGVKGVGAKTAQALIQAYGDLDNIYSNIENIEKKRWQTLLNEGKELAYISKQLVTLHTDAHALESLEGCGLPTQNPIIKIADLLGSYDLNKIVEKVHKNGLNYKTSIPESSHALEFKTITLDNSKILFDTLSSIAPNSIVSLDTETNSLDSNSAKIIGFSFCFNDMCAYYVPISHFYLGVGDQIELDDAKKALEILNTHRLVLQNFKYDYVVIKENFGLEVKLYADTMILAWLLKSDANVGLDSLSKRFFSHTMIAFKDVVKKGEDFSNIDIEKATQYAAEDALITYKLYFTLLKEFKDQHCESLIGVAHDVEFDFIKVLIYMESNGIKIDVDFFEKLKINFNELLNDLTQQIYDHANTNFNINSPKQLGEVLFEHLGLKASKKTKTGYSTNEAVLQKIKEDHPIVPLLLQYRENFKLKSTYIEPLLELGTKDEKHKIYTSFLQTGTATGRLSSKNPNLQNIPVKTQTGRQIRNGFVAQEGKRLIGIDYSQIELRLLAHYSQDEALLEAFNNDLDIHLQTATKIFGQDAAVANRGIAKSINFGLLYGMGSRKLAETIGVTPKEAKQYIDSYFESFATVKDFLKSIEDYALENNYVETLLKRRRTFDFENANGMQKPMFLREAVNTVFQGSASDLIKLSMIQIHKKYQYNAGVKMLLQIHDELIFEVDEELCETISLDLKNIMENIYTLRVPLKVSLSIGQSWGELK
ncbi:MAG: DNA polymerase I [Campylobacterota bacterium]|nr:DNA polymerase I [Campylobacterota bacterium]